MRDTTNADIQAIETLLETFQRAITSGDTGVLPPFFCEEATAYFSGSSDLVRGRQALVATWKRHLLQYTDVSLTRRDTRVRIHGDVAWAHFLWDGEGSVGGVRYRLIGERWTVVILWEDGAWRLAQMHTSMSYRDWERHKI